MNDEISIKIRSSKNEWHELKVNKDSLIQCLDKEILSKFLEETESKGIYRIYIYKLCKKLKL